MNFLNISSLVYHAMGAYRNFNKLPNMLNGRFNNYNQKPYGSNQFNQPIYDQNYYEKYPYNNNYNGRKKYNQFLTYNQTNNYYKDKIKGFLFKEF